MKYNIYEWRIKPISSFITKLQSDTIWGHIVWAINYLYGEKEVEKVIKESEECNAPFIVSNGFLSDYFPMINNKIISPPNNLKAISKNNNNYRNVKKRYTSLKHRMNETKYINLQVFNEMRFATNKQKIFLEILKNQRCPLTLTKITMPRELKTKDFLQNEDKYVKTYNLKSYNDFIEKKAIQKNAINRITNTTNKDDEVSLYSNEETYYNKDISIFIKIREDFDIDKFEKILNFIESTGFGKKASSGKGNFKKAFFKEKNDIFKMTYQGNGFIVLSNYIPKKDDYEDVIYSKVVAKRGKVSGGYCTRNNIFKKCFACFGEGSIFKGKPLNNKGRLLRGLTADPKIVQFGIPFIVGVDVDE